MKEDTRHKRSRTIFYVLARIHDRLRALCGALFPREEPRRYKTSNATLSGETFRVSLAVEPVLELAEDAVRQQIRGGR